MSAFTDHAFQCATCSESIATHGRNYRGAYLRLCDVGKGEVKTFAPTFVRSMHGTEGKR